MRAVEEGMDSGGVTAMAASAVAQQTKEDEKSLSGGSMRSKEEQLAVLTEILARDRKRGNKNQPELDVNLEDLDEMERQELFGSSSSSGSQPPRGFVMSSIGGSGVTLPVRRGGGALSSLSGGGGGGGDRGGRGRDGRGGRGRGSSSTSAAAAPVRRHKLFAMREKMRKKKKKMMMIG